MISVKHGFGALIFNGTVFLILSLVAHQIIIKNFSSESIFLSICYILITVICIDCIPTNKIVH